MKKSGPKRIEYQFGESVGPYSLIFVKENEPHINPSGYKNRKATFLCPECGQNFITYLKGVTGGRVKTCPKCSRKRSAVATVESNKKRFKDLTHQRFGHLTVLEKTDRRVAGSIIWKCKCDCGNIKEASSSDLVQGHTCSCGCLTSPDLVGKKFGRLTVLEKTEKRNAGNVVWKCKCDCGNIKEINRRDLVHGGIQSCGCLVSKGEAKISNVLNQLHINFISQKTFDNCLNIEQTHPLFFDFYLPDYNCCIEYDGEQHFHPVKHWGGEKRFQRQQQHDNIKNKYCEINNVKLIRVPYTDYTKIDEKYILNLLK